MEKMQVYHKGGVKQVAFWRIGQGPPDLWAHFGVDESGDQSKSAAAEAAAEGDGGASAAVAGT